MKQKIEIVLKIQETIEELSLGNVPAKQISPENRLIADLGLDSLDFATVMLTVEKWSGIKIKEDLVNWSAVQTVDQLAALFEEHQSHEPNS
jgi:acyl carrier protein